MEVGVTRCRVFPESTVWQEKGGWGPRRRVSEELREKCCSGGHSSLRAKKYVWEYLQPQGHLTWHLTARLNPTCRRNPADRNLPQILLRKPILWSRSLSSWYLLSLISPLWKRKYVHRLYEETCVYCFFLTWPGKKKWQWKVWHN